MALSRIIGRSERKPNSVNSEAKLKRMTLSRKDAAGPRPVPGRSACQEPEGVDLLPMMIVI
jgi:hypothetical protein